MPNMAATYTQIATVKMRVQIRGIIKIVAVSLGRSLSAAYNLVDHRPHSNSMVYCSSRYIATV